MDSRRTPSDGPAGRRVEKRVGKHAHANERANERVGKHTNARVGKHTNARLEKRVKVPTGGTVSIARALSKLGVCSRAEGERCVRAGRVIVNGVTVHDISLRVRPETDVIMLDSVRAERVPRVYLALNKPRGLVTTRVDPQHRATVYDCLLDDSLPFVGAVGRLDKASEGLLLLSNDTQWAAHITDPLSRMDKTYHVRVRVPATMSAEDLVARVAGGVTEVVSGEVLQVKQVSLLRVGSRSGAWLEIVLDEGRNRHIRRVLDALGVEVTRLMRVSIGALTLGTLAKGAWRHLLPGEVQALREPEQDTTDN